MSSYRDPNALPSTSATVAENGPWESYARHPYKYPPHAAYDGLRRADGLEQKAQWLARHWREAEDEARKAAT